MARDSLKSLELLAAARKGLAEKERRLMEGLARALQGTGFALTRVATSDGTVRSARPPRMRQVVRRMLRCPKCSRRFARAMHLGRHMAAAHKRKTAPRRASRRRARKRAR